MEKWEICMKKRGENTCKNEEVGDLHEKERGGEYIRWWQKCGQELK